MLRNWTVGLFTLVLAFLLAGTGFRAEPPAKDKPEKDAPALVMKEMIKVMGELADVLETIKDKDSALKVKTRLVDLKKRYNAVGERARKIKFDNLPKEEKEALEKKYKADLERAVTRLLGAMAKLDDPEVRKILKAVDQEAKKDEKKGEDKKSDEKKEEEKKGRE